MRRTTAHVAIRPIRCNLVSSESPGVYVEPTTILVGEHSAAVGLRARPIIVIASEPKLTPACSSSEEIKRGLTEEFKAKGTRTETVQGSGGWRAGQKSRNTSAMKCQDRTGNNGSCDPTK